MMFKYFVIVALFVAVALASSQEYYEKAFFDFIKNHNKFYGTAKNYDTRFLVFKKNLQKIDQHNADPKKTYSMKINEYADLTDEEFENHFNLNTPQDCSATNRKSPSSLNPAPLPPAMDWREKGVVNRVKNQGHCGSCWAFSTTAAMESHHAIKTGHLISLSEQQLVDCAGNFDNHGCRGGLPSHAFEYLYHAGGQETEQTYPYHATDGKCTFDRTKARAFTKGSYNITENDEEGIHVAVGTVGPVSIAYQVVSDFRFYHRGVYKSTHCRNGPKDVNHAVLAVGYNVTTGGEPYWIVKNSWGPSWGMGGYFWIERGHNMCGLATCASYPLV